MIHSEKKISRMIHVIVILLLLMIIKPGLVVSKNLGSFGKTYEIVEPDALVEIQKRAGEVDWSKTINKEHLEKTVKAYRPKGLIALPRATSTNTFTVNMSYTLDRDIPDGQGGVLYPRGYTFNPLDHVFLPNTIIILNGEDSEQLSWFQASVFANDIKVTLLLTQGPSFKLSEDLKRPVFYANKQIIQRLKVKAVPSIIMQKISVMEVQEIGF